MRAQRPGSTHAAVVRVYDAGEAPGLAFVVTEFLSGGSLEGQLLIGPLDPAVAVDLVSDLAIGVAAAHNVGLHGLSLTPRSVLFTATGAPRLVGIALAGYTARSVASHHPPIQQTQLISPSTQATPASSNAGGSTPSGWPICSTPP